MNLSSEPSIETLPDFFRNGVVETSVVNDQTIANYCSDTVRELNNLTEELKHTDLDDIGRSNMENHTNDRIKETAISSSKFFQNDLNESVHKFGNNNQLNTHVAAAANSEHSFKLKSDALGDAIIDNNIIGKKNNCDVVDSTGASSRFYIQLDQQIENNNLGSNTANTYINNTNTNALNYSTSNTFEYANGNVGGSLLDDDEYRMATCMLQSVDLRGNFLFFHCI